MSSVGANNGALNEEDENSDGSGSEGLEGEGGEEDEYSDEDECSSHHSVAEYNDVPAGEAEADGDSGANEVVSKDDEANGSPDPSNADRMCGSREQLCDAELDGHSSQHSVAEYNDMVATEAEADSDANEEAEKKETPEIGSKTDGQDQEHPDPTNPDPAYRSQDDVCDAEVDEQSSHDSVAEYNDVIASGAGADANEEPEKEQLEEIVSKIDGEDQGSPDPTNPDPACDSQDDVCDAEVDEQSSQHSVAEYNDVITSEADPTNPVCDSQEGVRDAEVDEHSSHHFTGEYHDVMGSEAEVDEEAEKKKLQPHTANSDPVCDSQEEVRDAEVDEHSSHHSTAEYHDVMGGEAEADANEEAEKKELQGHAANPDPVEVRDAEIDELSSHHSTTEYHDVMGSEAEADEASDPKEAPADIPSNVEGDATEATSETPHSVQSPQVFDISSPKADEPGAGEAKDEAAAAAEEEPAVHCWLDCLSCMFAVSIGSARALSCRTGRCLCGSPAKPWRGASRYGHQAPRRG